MYGGAGLGLDPASDLTCETETGVDLMLCQLRERILQISQCVVDSVNLVEPNQKIQRICTAEGIYLKGDTRSLDKRVTDAYEMLKGMVDRIPGNAGNVPGPKFFTDFNLETLTAAYKHFKSLIAAIQPIAVTEFPIYSDEYVRFLNTVKSVVNKLQTTFLEAMTEERAQTRQLSREAASFHDEERHSLEKMKEILSSRSWHKAQKTVNRMGAELEVRRSQLPSGPRGPPGASGLMGSVVTPPRVVAPPVVANNNSSWARASPVAGERVAVPAGGGKTRRRRN
jgi:hypothetical protein